jgi:hypothetical protein
VLEPAILSMPALALFPKATLLVLVGVAASRALGAPALRRLLLRPRVGPRQRGV